VSGSALTFRVQPGGCLRGSLVVPGDKSVSHRFVMLASLAQGRSEAHGFLEGEDALATVAAFRAMGVSIDGPHLGHLVVHGVGLQGLKAPAGALDMGNSGTAMRLLAGVLAGQPFDSVLTGDESLRQRPMGRIVTPLTAMGARLSSEEGGRPPLRIAARNAPLAGIEYDLPVASAQVKSCLLLAGLFASGEVVVHEPAPTRDHTERMLRGFGAEVGVQGARVSLEPGQRLTGTTLRVPADISSAAFFLAGACIAPDSDVVLRGVGVNPTRTGVLDVLEAMGADVQRDNPRLQGGEPTADLRVRYRRLRGIEIDPRWVPLAIDEFPALMVAAAFAEGDTVLRGAGELRVKESDRIAAVAGGLRALGVEVEEFPDGMRVRGGAPGGGVVSSRGDHRIAMAFAMAGAGARGAVTVEDCANVNTSFPGFVALARDAGLSIDEG
jgi:3-phosphoshikimate 1-carboxyvinyltransferase